MKLAVAQFAISYPDYYQGIFDPKSVEVRVGDKAVKLKEVVWNKDNNLIEIFPEDPVPANTRVEIWLENVKIQAQAVCFTLTLKLCPQEIYLCCVIWALGSSRFPRRSLKLRVDELCLLPLCSKGGKVIDCEFFKPCLGSLG